MADSGGQPPVLCRRRRGLNRTFDYGREGSTARTRASAINTVKIAEPYIGIVWPGAKVAEITDLERKMLAAPGEAEIDRRDSRSCRSKRHRRLEIVDDIVELNP